MANTRVVLSRATGRTVIKDNITGAAAIAAEMTAIRGAQLLSVSVSLNVAPIVSEFLTVTLDAVAGAAYDALLYKLDLSSLAVTSLIVTEEDFGEVWLVPGDVIVVDYANTGTAIYGVEIVTMESG